VEGYQGFYDLSNAEKEKDDNKTGMQIFLAGKLELMKTGINR